MEVKISKGDVFFVKAIGSINSKTALELEEAIKEYDGTKDLVFDFSELEYISSAGLRVILNVFKSAKAHDRSVTIKGASQDVRSVLEMTGFDSFITIE